MSGRVFLRSGSQKDSGAEPEATRRCNRCGECKPLDAFYPVAKGRPALLSRCKPCENARVRARFAPKSGVRRARVEAVRQADGSIALVKQGAA